MSFIQIENIKFSYDGNALYNDANVKIFDDEHVVLVGANGTGKSTLLKLLARRLSPDQGKIMIRDHLKNWLFRSVSRCWSAFKCW